MKAVLPALACAAVLAACGVAVAAAPPAVPAQTGDFPAPASLDNAGVSRWLHDYITVEGWTVLAADGKAVALGSPDGVAPRADGFLQATVRHEYYAVTQIGGKPTRSNLQTRVFDCAGKRQRVISMDIYEFNNLQGQSWVAANADAAWMTPQAGSLYLRVLERVCAAATRQAPVQ